VGGWVGLYLVAPSSSRPLGLLLLLLSLLSPFSLLFSFLLFSLGWFVVAALSIIGGHLSILSATNPLSCCCRIEPYPSSSSAVFQLLFHFLFCGSFEVFEIEFVFGSLIIIFFPSLSKLCCAVKAFACSLSLLDDDDGDG
jgi:hypothetical protein